ncbi:hypothetical protein D3C85_1374390 [compost metagenome]
MPSTRSVPSMPVTLTSSPIRKLTSAPTSRVATKRMAQAAMMRADGISMNSVRCSDREPPKVQATTPATIQVSSERASLTKPRLKLTRLEMAMMAMIVQSTQVNATVQPTN